MMRGFLITLSLLLVASVAVSAADSPVVVTHKPPQGAPLPDPLYPYMWYYRTEVHNASDRPFKVVWFEAFTEEDGWWYANNILDRTLRGREFSAWYTEGDDISNGVILPGQTAVCDVNWHGCLGSAAIGKFGLSG
jgi:hypothetical protein